MLSKDYSRMKILLKGFKHKFLAMVCLLILCFMFGCFPKASLQGKEIEGGSTENPINNTKESQQHSIIPSPTGINTVSHDLKILYEDQITLFTKTNEVEDDSFVDLDRGKLGIGDRDRGDLVYKISKGTVEAPYIKPVNGASAHLMETEKVDYDVCYQNIDLFTKGAIPDFFNGNAICLLTNEGRIAVIQYQNISMLGTSPRRASLLLSITVWEPIVTSSTN